MSHLNESCHIWMSVISECVIANIQHPRGIQVTCDLGTAHMDGSCHTSCATRCNTLQHTATHCNTLQHDATQCNRWVMWQVKSQVQYRHSHVVLTPPPSRHFQQDHYFRGTFLLTIAGGFSFPASHDSSFFFKWGVTSYFHGRWRYIFVMARHENLLVVMARQAYILVIMAHHAYILVVMARHVYILVVMYYSWYISHEIIVLVVIWHD